MSSKKLYCYVDETGQDTVGKLFVVVAIVVENEREKLLDSLEQAEKRSGKTRRKWIKSRTAERNRYLDMALIPLLFKGKIFYKIFANTKEYEDLMVLVIGKALNLYAETHGLTDYKATIIIDGLKKTETKRVAKSLRQLGVKIRKVRGEKDENNALLRLSDAMAGVIREAAEGEKNYTKLIKKLAKEKVMTELKP